MRSALGLISALWNLARLAVLTRFRFGGDYWTWRMHTAFGRGTPTSRLELLAAILRYGRWMGRMRRISRV